MSDFVVEKDGESFVIKKAGVVVGQPHNMKLTALYEIDYLQRREVALRQEDVRVAVEQLNEVEENKW